MSDLRQGRIVWVTMTDPQGRNPKSRPAVILTSTPDIPTIADITVAAITTQIGMAPHDVTVALPWHRDGHPRTRFRSPSEVVCNWLLNTPKSTLQPTLGFVPAREMFQILEIVAKLASTIPNETSEPPTSPTSPPPPS